MPTHTMGTSLTIHEGKGGKWDGGEIESERDSFIYIYIEAGGGRGRERERENTLNKKEKIESGRVGGTHEEEREEEEGGEGSEIYFRRCPWPCARSYLPIKIRWNLHNVVNLGMTAWLCLALLMPMVLYTTPLGLCISKSYICPFYCTLLYLL